ncbi:uncharacterized protein LOC114130235 isoform X3 [Aphis gossypii]|uniref:uncharacterized protein LOC114130235 isoform X3 n=1 Tax=Aphis gossypii TaxID=80765 RepID=UPI002158FE1A|nr:uncharacterized protein LOC114130235 isoform X3 [Aphis gossypii]
MQHISFAVVYIVIFGLSSSNFLDCHLQDTAYREIRRLFPSEWKRANCGGFFVGKKFVGYTMFDNNYGGKMRKMSKTVPKIDNYERVPYDPSNYVKWHH